MPLSQAIKAQRLNPKREPKGIADFVERYSAIKRTQRIIPYDAPFRLPRAKTRKTVSYVAELVGREGMKANGRGVQLVFPLTSALGHGEFVRGVLKVIAPEARVVFLVTPRSPHLSSAPFSDADLDYARLKAYSNLKKHVVKSMRPAARTVIVDDHDSGGTFRAIKETAVEAGMSNENKVERKDTWPLGDFILDYYCLGSLKESRRKINLGWNKTREGDFAMNPEDWRRKMGYVGEPLPPEVTLEPPRTRAESNLRRRILYNLGIAAGKEYLKMQKKKV